MNTSDIRDMSSRQWIFWSIAIPLTVIIIIIGLIWAGEMGNCWRGVLRLLQVHSTGPGTGAVSQVRIEDVTPISAQVKVMDDEISYSKPIVRTAGLISRRRVVDADSAWSRRQYV
ncbi:hypothetical protein M501DRAFT_255285 [Patellaria atrata CBS 101060]|uniref:Uncharacterized protein n=1 Tax=Patellaria atrata CBS 101060 TaxID=1346257 RepID=A0A9P4S6I6_9PEZI|nr:hypothetical protein M501DRAFT_255285 [Patellaria atrata CBS 101060]